MILNLPDELKIDILLYLQNDLQTLKNISKTCTHLFQIINDDYFWYQLFQIKYPVYFINYGQPFKQSWRYIYLSTHWQYRLTHPLNNIGWFINQTPEMIVRNKWDDYDRKIKTKFKFKGPIILSVPATGFYEYYETITINKKIITENDIIEAIYDYYQKPLTLADLLIYEKVSDDYYNLIRNAIQMVQDNQIVEHFRIMGDLLCFDGLSKYLNYSNLFTVDLNL